MAHQRRAGGASATSDGRHPLKRTYLEKLKAIKAQYEALGYKLDKLIEAESGTPKEKPDAFVTRDQAAKLLKCTVRQIDRLAQRYSICKYKMSGRILIRKADIIDTQTHPKIEVRGRRFNLDI